MTTTRLGGDGSRPTGHSPRPGTAPPVLVDRQGLQVLDDEEAMSLLASQPVGRVAIVRDGRPVILPVNHTLDGPHIVFRTAPGAKLDVALRPPALACFEADDHDPVTGTGWSVVVEGRLEAVLDAVDQARLDRLGLHPWAEVAPRPHWLRLVSTTISGRRILPRGDRRQPR